MSSNELRNEILSTISEYSNDLFEGESYQRWKSEGEVTDHIMKLIKESENVK